MTHHMNEIMVLMQNYSDVQKYMSEAADSSGTSMQKYEAYTDSLAGRFCLYVQKCAQRTHLIAGNALQPYTTIIRKLDYDGLTT